MAVSLDYCHTVNSNIELFLKDKTRKLTVNLENIREDFVTFWKFIGAEGDIDKALAEFDICHNASNESKNTLAEFLNPKNLFAKLKGNESK